MGHDFLQKFMPFYQHSFNLHLGHLFLPKFIPKLFYVEYSTVFLSRGAEYLFSLGILIIPINLREKKTKKLLFSCIFVPCRAVLCRGTAMKNRCRAVPCRAAAPNFERAVPCRCCEKIWADFHLCFTQYFDYMFWAICFWRPVVNMLWWCFKVTARARLI